MTAKTARRPSDDPVRDLRHGRVPVERAAQMIHSAGCGVGLLIEWLHRIAGPEKERRPAERW